MDVRNLINAIQDADQQVIAAAKHRAQVTRDAVTKACSHQVGDILTGQGDRSNTTCRFKVEKIEVYINGNGTGLMFWLGGKRLNADGTPGNIAAHVYLHVGGY